MKMNQITRFLTIFGLAAVLFTGCKDEETGPTFHTPVLNEDFTIDVDSNDVTFYCSMEKATAVVWILSNTDEPVTENPATVNFPVKGTYSVICGVSDGGDYLYSDTAKFVITDSDLTYLEEGFWKALTGGIEGGKVWRLDDFMSTGGNEYNKYFTSALKYYQYTGDGDASSWNNGGHNLYESDWSSWAKNAVNDSGPEIGTITFDGAAGTATLTMEDGVDIATGTSGQTFTITGEVDIEVQDDAYGYKGALDTLYGFTLSDEWAYVSFSSPLRMPMDKARLLVPEYTTTDDGTLYNIKIVSCTDSALMISVNRVYEADGTESDCQLLYNYICDDYTYTYDDPDAQESFTFSEDESVNTAFTKDDLVGTWKLAQVPTGWIQFNQTGDQGTVIPTYLYEKWDTRAECVATLESWGLSSIDSAFTANEDNSYVFNSDGSCTLNGVANTFTVADGVITLGTDLAETEFSIGYSWMSNVLTGTEIKVIDVTHYTSEVTEYTPEGTWIGQKNGDKDEFTGFQLVKQ